MWWKAAFLLALPALRAQTVEGSLANSITHAPVSGVTVTITGPATYTVVSDVAGKYRFSSVQPGEYTPKIKKDGFVALNACLKPLRVTDGDLTRDCEMEPTVRLQGRVLYPDGRPVARATLWIMLYPAGGVLGSSTDENGRFLMEGLGQGAYLLRASAPRGESAPEDKAWAPTYFPNAVERDGAEPVRLRPGADVSGYDIRLRSVPVRVARGVVRDTAGKPVAGAAVELIPVERNMGAEQRLRTGDDGAFEFRAVRPGEWLFGASWKQDRVEWRGVAQRTVGRADVEDVDVRVAPPFTVRGFVDREEPRDAKGARKVTAVSLTPVIPGYTSRPVEFHAQDGALTIANVYPARYKIEPLGFVPGYYLDSVKLGEREVFGQEVELTDGLPPIRITYRANAPRVRGTVEKGDGAVVALIPEDEAMVDDQFIRTAQADRDGRFEVGSLWPGHYYAFAFDRVESRSLSDAAFVRLLAPRAVKVHVEKGELAKVDLKVTPWPE